MTVAFTGHRPDKLGFEYDYEGPYSEYLFQEIGCILKDIKPTKGIVGMALGVDTIAALECLYQGIPVTAAIPFKGQESRWPEKSQEIYKKILAHKLVTPVYVCEPGYHYRKMQIRNEWMVDRCDVLIAVWDETEGGTFNCIKYADKKKQIIYIDPRNAIL